MHDDDFPLSGVGRQRRLRPDGIVIAPEGGHPDVVVLEMMEDELDEPAQLRAAPVLDVRRVDIEVVILTRGFAAGDSEAEGKVEGLR